MPSVAMARVASAIESCCVFSPVPFSRDRSNVCALQVYSVNRIAFNIRNRIRRVLNGYRVSLPPGECVRSTDLISIVDGLPAH